MNRIGHWINNKVVLGASGRSGVVFNPATGEQQAAVDFASVAELDAVVASAKAALPGWRSTSLSRRAEVMFRMRELVDANRKEIANIVSLEHGKVPADAMGELARGLENIEFACGIPALMKGGYSEQAAGGVDVYSIRQPLGVVAGITPFNFPAMVPMWMFPLAIACGNTFILKPSEKNPSCSLRLAELLKEAGLPDGVFNVVNGDKESVDALLSNPNVSAISFVGSTPIAKYIYESAAKFEKRVQALGGAKNHCVVMPDADLDQAVAGLMGAAYGSAGERCMAQSVAVAVGNIGDELVNKLTKEVNNLKVGPGLDKGMDMGPLVTAQHLEKVTSYIDIGVKEGAKLIVDGRKINKPQGHEKGFYLGGCLFDHVKENMRIYKEEIFGPVLSVVRAKDFNEAVDLINKHEFGNGVSIFTRDGDSARTFSSHIKVGMVGINIPIPVPMAFHSFGGWKRSLFGDQHVHGMEGVRFYTKLKTITSRWPSGIKANSSFTMPTMS